MFSAKWASRIAEKTAEVRQKFESNNALWTIQFLASATALHWTLAKAESKKELVKSIAYMGVEILRPMVALEQEGPVGVVRGVGIRRPCSLGSCFVTVNGAHQQCSHGSRVHGCPKDLVRRRVCIPHVPALLL